MKEYNIEKKSEKIDLSKIESKIKEKIKNDKENFKEKRREADEYYKTLGFKSYEDWINYNGKKDTEDDTNNKRYYGPTVVKKNFLISYDKDLKPENIKENLKEIPIKKAKAMKLLNDEDSKNNLLYNQNINNMNSNLNDNNYEYNNNLSKDYLNQKSDKTKDYNYYKYNNNDYDNYNREDRFIKEDFNNYKIYQNDGNMDKNISNNLKNYNKNTGYNSEENIQENEREMLSSFSPSEKTKSN